MAYKYKSRIPEIDPENPQSWGRDDITGLPVMQTDMIKQMEYGPQGLYWTGFLVHWKDADEPNPQLVPPRLKPDPVPIANPRIFYRPQLPLVPQNVQVETITTDTVTISWSLSLASGDIPAADSYIILAANYYDPSNYIQASSITSPYTITDLVPGNTYNIAVAAVTDNIGTSAFSYPPLQVTMLLM